MAFNTKKFTQTKFTARTTGVPVPDMSQWFDEGDAHVWTVRGLTGKEVGICKQAAAKNKSIAGIMSMLKSAKVTEQTKALQSLFDMDPKGTPENIAERLEQIIMGSVEPECNLTMALKICEAFPVCFYDISNAVLKLTGEGMEPGKPKKSGKKAT